MRLKMWSGQPCDGASCVLQPRRGMWCGQLCFHRDTASEVCSDSEGIQRTGTTNQAPREHWPQPEADSILKQAT